MREILAADANVTGIVVNYNTKKSNVILGERFETLYGEGYLEDMLLGLTFRLSPAAFYQVNHDQAERLYEKAIEFAGFTGEETALDLYCGSGTITLCLARHVKTVSPFHRDKRAGCIGAAAQCPSFPHPEMPSP